MSATADIEVYGHLGRVSCRRNATMLQLYLMTHSKSSYSTTTVDKQQGKAYRNHESIADCS